MKSLYQISKEAVELASALEDGELTPEMENSLLINQNELQEKAINYGYVVKTIENDITAIDEEIKRLQALKKAKNNAINRMKDSVCNAMSVYGIEKIESPTLKLSVRRSESIEILDNLDPNYMLEKITYSPDKIRIKNDIKKGENVHGAVIKENFNLIIK